jgi:hypothetical protein
MGEIDINESFIAHMIFYFSLEKDFFSENPEHFVFAKYSVFFTLFSLQQLVFWQQLVFLTGAAFF